MATTFGPLVFRRGYWIEKVIRPVPPPVPCPECGTTLNRHLGFLSCPKCEHCEETQ